MAKPEGAGPRTRGHDDRPNWGGAGAPSGLAFALVASAAMDMSIVICTLDRPEGLVRAVRSCLEQDDRGTLAYEVRGRGQQRDRQRARRSSRGHGATSRISCGT